MRFRINKKRDNYFIEFIIKYKKNLEPITQINKPIQLTINKSVIDLLQIVK